MEDLVSVILLKTTKIVFRSSRFNKGYYERAQRKVNIIGELEGRIDRDECGRTSQALTKGNTTKLLSQML